MKIPVDGARLEIEEPGGPAGPPDRLRALLRAHERSRLVEPVAELRTRRHGALVTRDGTTAEVTIDEVSVMDAQRVESAFVELEIELKEGDEVEVQVAGERAFDVGRDRSRERALARIRALRKSLPADWRFDREDANVR